MKKTLSFLAIVALSACGTNSTSSKTEGFPGFNRGRPVRPLQIIPNWGEVAKVSFSADERPVDGDLREVILTMDADGKYDASLHISLGGLVPNPPANPDSTEDIAFGLECQNQFADEAGTLTGVSCSVDRRLVDGGLTEVLFQREAEGFTAKLIETPARGGEARVRDLASHLSLSILQQ